MRVHLVTYATPRFRLRQLLLGVSARINRVAHTVTSWTPTMLLDAGFEGRCNDLKLTERGSGFWAWKPFVIDVKLRQVPDGDMVFYCDVGRLYPFKLLDQPITPFVRWMDDQDQDLMPGVEIPWDGCNSVWTKREAMVATGMDHLDFHSSAPVQASFSIWRAGPRSREFVGHWLDLCAQRRLISDDPSETGLPERPEFRGHRHDQALLTLCCRKMGIAGLDLGSDRPDIDLRHPSQVSRLIHGSNEVQRLGGTLLRLAASPIWHVERWVRRKLKFGDHINE